eukprot:NODE_71_length_23666_cov_0.239403.p6 type:complete len:479 gc:universal NODE_71_length_23666_cov_0.239403:1547-2983(+)
MIYNSLQKLNFGGRLTRTGSINQAVEDLIGVVNMNPNQMPMLKMALFYLFFTRSDLKSINMIVDHLEFGYVCDDILQVIGLYSSLEYTSTVERMQKILRHYDEKIVWKEGGLLDSDFRKKSIFRKYGNSISSTILQIVSEVGFTTISFLRLVSFTKSLVLYVETSAAPSFLTLVPELLKRWKMMAASDCALYSPIILRLISSLSNLLGESLTTRSIWPRLVSDTHTLCYNPFQSSVDVQLFRCTINKNDNSAEVRGLADFYCIESNLLSSLGENPVETINALNILQERHIAAATKALWYINYLKSSSLAHKTVITVLKNVIKMSPQSNQKIIAKYATEFKQQLVDSNLISTLGYIDLDIPDMAHLLPPYEYILEYKKLSWTYFPQFYMAFLSRFKFFKLEHKSHLFEHLGYLLHAICLKSCFSEENLNILLQNQHNLVQELLGIYLLHTEFKYPKIACLSANNENLILRSALNYFKNL